MEVVDAIMMVGVTLVAASALVLLISSIDGPAERVNADLALAVDPGDNGWGTGDERLIVRHKAGEAFSADQVSFKVQANGTTHWYNGSTLGFQDDTFRLGHQWDRTYTIPLLAKVTFEAIVTSGEEVSTGSGIGGASVTGGGRIQEILFSGSVTAVGVAPDLEVTIMGTDPPLAYTGGPDVAFRARVSNLGNEPITGPFDVRFVVDGVDLGTKTQSGGLGIGSSVDILSDPWDILPYNPASPWTQVGIHTAVAIVDPDDVIIELLETNNADTHLFQVSPGVYDPGHAYEDDNGDGLYTPGFDTPLTNGQVEDGHHNAKPGNGLVIPPSVGPISNVNLYQVQSNATIIIAVNLTATSGQIHIKTTEGSVILDGISIVTSGSIKVEMTHGTSEDGISIVGSYLEAGTTIDIDAKDGYVLLTESTIKTGSGAITVLAQDGHLDADDSVIDSGAGIHLDSTGDATVRRADLRAVDEIVIDVTQATNTVHLEGARIDDADDTLQILPTGTTVDGTPETGGWTH